MKLVFKEVRITNFLSIGTATVNLTNRGFVLVEGINSQPKDNAKSNGSGKSSILESIIWAITGSTIRGTKDVVNRYSNDGAAVELDFEIDNDKYSLTRTREHSKYGNNLKIIKNGADISGKGLRDSEKVLEETIPDLNAQLLGSVVVLGQGLPQRFTNNTPAGRKDILEKLSKSDYMIEDVKSKLSSRKLQLQELNKKLEDSRLVINTKANSSKSTISFNTSKIEDLVIKLNNIESSSLAQLKEEAIKLNHEKQVIEETLKYNEETLAFIKDKFNTEQRSLIDECGQAMAPISNEITKLEYLYEQEQNRLKTKNRELYDIQSIQTSCPTCKRPYDEVHKPDTSYILQEIHEIEASINNYKESISTSKEKLRVLKEQFDIKLSEGSKEFVKQEVQFNYSISEDKRELQLVNNALREKESKIKLIEIESIKFKAELETLKDIIKRSEKEIIDLDKQLEELAPEFEDITRRQEVITKLLSLAQRDFRTYLLEDIVKLISEKSVKYSNKLFNGRTIKLIADTNQIDILIDDKPYESLSGGERQKVDLIIQFSLRDMLMTILNFSSNILALDEVFDNLDSHGSISLVDLILEELNDIDSVFIITHHSDITIPYDDKITIYKKEDGTSTLIIDIIRCFE